MPKKTEASSDAEAHSDEPAAPKRRATAESMAARQREISVSEFFTKNRHLLGFDNPAKALLTTVKEAVDNSLDACEEAGILPEILVEIREVAGAAPAEGEGRAPGGGPSRFRVIVEDNGPGIVKPQIPKIFAKLLYGSKFHRLKQSRGQQGIGISAAGLYGQLTTGKPVVITSKTGKGRPAYVIHLRIDTKRNQPDVVREETVEWAPREHGTRVEIELVATYRGGRTGVQEYLEQAGVSRADGGRQPAPRAHLRVAERRAPRVSAGEQRASARGAGDQAAPARRRARDAAHDALRLARQEREAGPRRRFLPRIAGGGAGGLRSGQGEPEDAGRKGAR
jgi:DNA topoisomerase-6 subunit B